MRREFVRRWGVVLACVLLMAFAVVGISHHTPPKVVHGQTAPIACSQGQAVSSQLANTGQGCTTFTGTVGTDVVQANLVAALGSQTICDTTSTCPAGFAILCYSVAPTTAGTLVSAVGVNLTYTDDGGLHTNQSLNSSVSLITKTSVGACYPFYHAANTAVSLSTSVTGALTGGATYTVRTRLLW